MVKAPIYTIKGTKTGEITLPKGVFEVKPNLKLLAQAIHVYEERSHIGLRNTKTRSEVNRTTKKVYKQKGTGGARHGSRRANLFVGGGVALGPRAERRILTLPSGVKEKAKIYAFSAKASDGAIVAVSGIAKIVKTKEAGEFLKKLIKERFIKEPRRGARFTFVLSDKAKEALKFLKNLGNAKTVNYKDITALDIWRGGVLVLDNGIFEVEKPVKKVEEKPVKKTAEKKVKASVKKVAKKTK